MAKRRIRYSVAMSLDGFIADSEGGYAWIPQEDAIDFTAFLSTLDTFVMGRGTYETVQAEETGSAIFEGKKVYVVSRTLDPAEHPDVEVIGSEAEARIAEMKEEEGLDIWLFGGGVLFRGLLEAGLVDRVEVAIVPALLGEGIPVLPGAESPHRLVLHSTETFPGSGLVLAKYDVVTA